MKHVVRRLTEGVTGDHLVAGVLVGVGFVLTAWLGFLSATTSPPSAGTSTLLVVLAGFFQVAGALRFHRIGKADPTLARASVRRLFNMALHARQGRQIAEATFEQGTTAELRRAMGRLSVELSWIEEGLAGAVEDWTEFHRDALRTLLAEEAQDVED